ncbi:GNAT family N-acetyltransferase [Halomonas stenophila]|uniref:Ribosomal protein S18 acetylase RimI-like enzyme n=1 Tax=Halomonas stenophila TaxID=795312 RepID=A0A7W5EQI5_9GAMM|nr:GNAT family N-acetyltransferase [Halomonas stenophila]MBB3229593.1 ribosomal protein S18 acetylase RimI-like enzyme [Halomonas stenophila]
MTLMMHSSRIWHAGPGEIAGWELPLRRLVREEQARQAGALIRGVDLDAYLDRVVARGEFVLLTLDEHLGGFCAFYAFDPALDSAFITLFVVAPEGRGLGLAEAMLACVATQARQRGYRYLTLWVGEDNVPALRFYRRQGFRVLAHDDEKGQVFVRLTVGEA